MSRLLFSQLPEQLRRSSQRYKLDPGDVLFNEGSSAESLFFIETGCVRLVVFPSDGKQLVLYRARDGEMFAEEHLSRSTYKYTAIADKPTILQSVRTDSLLELITADKASLLSYLSSVSDRYHQLCLNFERLGLPSASAKVLHLLRSLSQGNKPLNLTGRVKTLASDLNLTHETMYRTLRTLEEQGAITRQDGWVIVTQSLPWTNTQGE